MPLPLEADAAYRTTAGPTPAASLTDGASAGPAEPLPAPSETSPVDLVGVPVQDGQPSEDEAETLRRLVAALDAAARPLPPPMP